LTPQADASNSVSGFILTRQWRETEEGLELIFWIASEQGAMRLRLANQEAVCFVSTTHLTEVKNCLRHKRKWRHADTRLKNFQHEPVSALYFTSQRLLLDCRELLIAQNIPVFEADIKPVDRFLMERFITGGVSVSASHQAVGNFHELTDAKLKAAEVRPQLSALSIDIETNYAADQLFSIGIYGPDLSLVIMIGDSAGDLEGKTQGAQATLVLLPTAKDVIKYFLAFVQDKDPDVLIGWNVVNFDLRVLQKICDREAIDFALGRDKETVIWRKSRLGSDRYYALVPGRVVLDGIELMRTATYQFENFSLEHVAQALLQRGKLVEDVDQRGAEIEALFANDKPALARYNLEDCRLVWDIFSREQLFSFAIERSLLTGLELDRYGGSVAAFDFLYLPRLHRKGFVAPSLDQIKSLNFSPGGYVMDSRPGIYDNVIVLDFKSLYPSIIRTFLVDPLGLVAADHTSDWIPGFDGGMFSRQQHILPEIISTIWQARDKAKSEHNAVLSQAIKIIMNSFYGVLGTPGCRFFDSRLVSSITRRGHEIIIESKTFIEKQGYQVIYGDTDSVFVLIGAASIKSVSQIGSELEDSLNQWWTNRLQNELQLESCLEIQFETHFNKFLMPTVRGAKTGSKKRYAGLVRSADTEQFKLIFKGLESVRSDWSPLAREFQQHLYQLIFLDQPYEEYIKQTVADVFAGNHLAKLVLRKRVRRKLADYVKNVPPHVQAARNAELIRAQRNLPPLFNSGGWIEYVMTTAGAQARQYQTAPIDFDFYIDKQLAPIADSILTFRASSLEAVLDKQIGLF